MIKHLFNNYTLPVVEREADIVGLLKDPSKRAVTLRDPNLYFDPKHIRAIPNPDLAEKYWSDPAMEARGRRISGLNGYDAPLSVKNVQSEADAASIHIDPAAVGTLTERCSQYRAIFSRVFEAYTGLRNTKMIGRILFTPQGGQGRSPEIHVDNTILTLHWSIALSELRIYHVPPTDEMWRALKGKQANVSDFQAARNKDLLLRTARKSGPNKLGYNEIGDVVIGKGKRGKDLDRPKDRGECFVHTSSDRVKDFGQAAFLITPKM